MAEVTLETVIADRKVAPSVVDRIYNKLIDDAIVAEHEDRRATVSQAFAAAANEINGALADGPSKLPTQASVDAAMAPLLAAIVTLKSGLPE